MNTILQSNVQGRPLRWAALRRMLIVLFLVSGLMSAGRGGWIFAKARLAQVLLELSWRSALAGRSVKPWPWADTVPIARLRLDRDGTAIIILAGASGRTMAFGPGHLDGTAMPGESGNCIISAHRDTHFAALKNLAPGDIIELQTRDGRVIHYSVRGSKVVGKHDLSVLSDDGRPRLTLITCYPFDAIIPGGPLRYVVEAEKI
jgi:sortase A